jgi:hypothetical protein
MRLEERAYFRRRERRLVVFAPQRGVGAAPSAERERKAPCSLAPQQRGADGHHPEEIEHERLHSFDDSLRCMFQPKTFSPFDQQGCRLTCSKF